MDGDRSLVTCGDGVDGELGAGVGVAAREDVGLGGLVGHGVGHGTAPTPELHGRPIKQASPLDALPDGEYHARRRHEGGVALVVGGREATVLVEHARAALERDAPDAAVLAAHDLGRTPAVVDGRAVLGGLGALLLARRHLGRALEAPHRDGLGAQARGRAGHVDGHVAAAHDHRGPVEREPPVAGRRQANPTRGLLEAPLARLRHGDRPQEVHGHRHAGALLAGHARKPASLTANRQVERLEALRAQLVEGHVAPNLHVIAELRAHRLDDGDLGCNDVLLQLVAGDSVGEHAARTGAPLEHHGVVALLGQVVGAREARRARAYDGHALGEVALHLGAHLGRHVAGRRVELGLGHELLDLVDGHRAVDGAARAGVLAAAVADAPAHRRQRVFAPDERERVGVAALGGKLEVALHRHVRRAGRLAGRRTRVVGLDAVGVTVARAPLLGPPLHLVGKLLLGIAGHGVRAPVAELLAELHRTGRAHLHAAAAGHAALGVGVRHVGRARQVGRVEQLARAQRVAHVHVAVADGEDLVLAVDVGDLVHEAVVLGAPEDLVDLVAVDVAAAIGLDHVVGHVAHGDAPVVIVVAATLAHHLAAHAAAAGARGVLAVVLVEPVPDVLDRDGVVLVLDGALDRDDVHADARTSRRHHRRGAAERALAGLLEELGEDGVLRELPHAHVEELGRAGHEHGQHPLLGAGGILPVVLEQSRVGEPVEHRLERDRRDVRGLGRRVQGVGPAHLEVAEHLGLVVGSRLGKGPVLIGQKLVLAQEPVGAVPGKRHDGRARAVRQGPHELGADVGLGEGDAGAVDRARALGGLDGLGGEPSGVGAGPGGTGAFLWRGGLGSLRGGASRAGHPRPPSSP